MNTLIYPGSFDPITLGHLDIIRRAAKMCDTLCVVVMVNNEKACYFSPEERVELIRRCVLDIPNVQVDYFDGLTVDYMRRVGAAAAVRGLRAISDYEYELQWVTLNQILDPSFEAVFMMASGEHSFLSSSIVRQIASYGGDISRMVAPEIFEEVKNKLSRNKEKQA
ncbi:MAG: pantetheine-phosphate adenylyltransferase [Clostridia bacterium]|nr:pantetheine-phosphate adenylyltransferase [Clostridia bacterium]